MAYIWHMKEQLWVAWPIQFAVSELSVIEPTAQLIQFASHADFFI